MHPNNHAPIALHLWRTGFAAVLVVYCVMVVAAAEFIYREFGPQFAVVSLVDIVPVVIVIRRIRQRGSIASQEALYVVILMAACATGVVVLCARLYNSGIDKFRRAEIEIFVFLQVLHEEPAFNRVKLLVSPKHNYYLSGTVATSEEHERLLEMASQLRFATVGDSVVVLNSPESQMRVGD